jgi:hypothetical protein
VDGEPDTFVERKIMVVDVRSLHVWMLDKSKVENGFDFS